MKTWIIKKEEKEEFYLTVADNAMLALSYLFDKVNEEFSLEDVKTYMNSPIFEDGVILKCKDKDSVEEWEEIN